MAECEEAEPFIKDAETIMKERQILEKRLAKLAAIHPANLNELLKTKDECVTIDKDIQATIEDKTLARIEKQMTEEMVIESGRARAQTWDNVSISDKIKLTSQLGDRLAKEPDNTIKPFFRELGLRYIHEQLTRYKKIKEPSAIELEEITRLSLLYERKVRMLVLFRYLQKN
uniref:Coiled-coil domain-containing protein 22 homolog n=1 Tax=Rhabditophanes sp. KR3021 TaxID=114890 RepID=A0AC35UC49_9BILA